MAPHCDHDNYNLGEPAVDAMDAISCAQSVAQLKTQFVEAAGRVLARYCRQNEAAGVGARTILLISERLWEVVRSHALPPSLAVADMGEPKEMTSAEVASFIEVVLDGIAEREALSAPVGQMVKACFYPEFRKCRDSYREIDATGACRRQQLAKAKARVSGAHCVDCPYWMGLSPEQHRDCLVEAWRGDSAEFAGAQDVFLPEDFRTFRMTVRQEARSRG